MKIDVVIILLVLFCALLGAFGQILFKLSSDKFALSLEGILFNWKFLLGATFYALSAALFVYALKFGNLSILYPIIATSYIWVSLFAHFLLGEPFPLYKSLGILMIIFGIGIVVK